MLCDHLLKRKLGELRGIPDHLLDPAPNRLHAGLVDLRGVVCVGHAGLLSMTFMNCLAMSK